MTKVTVMGSGAWGTALACVSVRAGHETCIWARSENSASAITTDHMNPDYLPGLKLEDGIAASTDLPSALEKADMVLLAVPAQALSSLLPLIGNIAEKSILVTTCKGIDRETGYLPAQLVRNEIPDARVAALSGPSFAADVVRGLPTAVTIGAGNLDIADQVARALSGGNFRCYSIQPEQDES